jgi:hypothetical protein
LAVITSPENPDGRLSRLIGSGETGGGPSTPEIRIVGRRGVAKQADRIRGDRRRSLHSGNPDRRSAGGRLSKLIGSGETGGGPSTPEIRIVGRRVSLSKLIGSGETGGGPSTPEIRIVGRRMSLSKLIGSGETGGGPSTPEIRIVGPADRRSADGA